MARPSYASFLPTIKCSNCGREIEISAMGDHLCTGEADAAPKDEQPQIGRTDHDRIPPSHLELPQQAGPLRPLNVPAPTQQTAEPIESFDFLLPPKDLRQSPEPTTTSAERVSTANPSPTAPRPAMPLRSATEPVSGPLRPPSADFPIPQDSPFPTFPTGKSIARANVPGKLAFRSQSDAEPGPNTPSALQSPSVMSATVLKRMNSIAPGPFNARSKKEGERNGPRSPLPPAMSATSTPESKAAISPTDHPPQRPLRPETDDSLYEQLQQTSTNGSLQTPFLAQPQARPGTPRAAAARHEALEPISLNELENDETAVLPLPHFSQSNLFDRGHSLTESESSTASRSVSDSRTASSRSSHSPLASNASSDANHKLSIDNTDYTEPSSVATSLRAASVDVSIQQARGTRISADSPATTPIIGINGSAASTPIDETEQGQLRLSTVRSAPSPSSHQDRLPGSATSPGEFDAGIRLSSLRYDPNASKGRASGPPPQPLHRLETKKRSPAPKGNCRGCGNLIVGKSIKAADGRLSGRWHRECFTCKTCKSQFQTADFYVLDDQPYCAHHYHVLNHSLCRQCNTGIEGKYLETQPSQKYHLACFTCHDCHKPLTLDYFEINHQFYCETDAYRVWQKSKMLTPGRRFPEKRKTRLMMMSRDPNST